MWAISTVPDITASTPATGGTISPAAKTSMVKLPSVASDTYFASAWPRRTSCRATSGTTTSCARSPWARLRNRRHREAGGGNGGRRRPKNCTSLHGYPPSAVSRRDNQMPAAPTRCFSATGITSPESLFDLNAMPMGARQDLQREIVMKLKTLLWGAAAGLLSTSFALAEDYLGGIVKSAEVGGKEDPHRRQRHDPLHLGQGRCRRLQLLRPVRRRTGRRLVSCRYCRYGRFHPLIDRT